LAPTVYLVKDDVLVKDESVEARTALAKKHPNRLVIFLRGVAGGFSSGDSPYVTLDRFQPSHVAHEIGHYLHLHHTHDGRVYIAVLGSDKRVYLRWSL
jgi:hypothetical protein